MATCILSPDGAYMDYFEKPNSNTKSAFSSFQLAEKAFMALNELSQTGSLNSHEYPNNDFWAPSCLAVLRSSSHSIEMIKQDIRMSLRQQKISPPDLRDLHVQP